MIGLTRRKKMIEEYLGDSFESIVNEALENLESFATFLEENKPKVVYVKIRYKKKKFKSRKMISYNPMIDLIPSFPFTFLRRRIEKKEEKDESN